MDQSILSIIEQKVNFLYKKKLVKNWPSDLMNAEFTIKYAWCNNTIFDLLKKVIFRDNLCLHNTVDHEDDEIRNEVGATTSDTQMWEFYKSNLTDIEYFNTLAISKWEYDEFILSALVFCIKSKLHNENLLKNFSYTCAGYFAPLFLNETSLSNNIFSCIVELKLFDFFPTAATKGFIHYLNPFFTSEINIKGRLKAISKFLYIFSFFPVCFIKQCLLDCKEQQNLNPLILSLYVLCVNSQNLKNEKFFASKELDNFKKQLVRLNLVNKEFIHKCNVDYFKDKQKNIPLKNYYSCFD